MPMLSMRRSADFLGFVVMRNFMARVFGVKAACDWRNFLEAAFLFVWVASFAVLLKAAEGWRGPKAGGNFFVQ